MEALPAAPAAGDVMVWLQQNLQRLGDSALSRAIILEWVRDTLLRLSDRFALHTPPVARAWPVTGIGPECVKTPDGLKYKGVGQHRNRHHEAIRHRAGAGTGRREDFRYSPESNTDRCPAGEQLV
jgi:hypothetical protein